MNKKSLGLCTRAVNQNHFVIDIDPLNTVPDVVNTYPVACILRNDASGMMPKNFTVNWYPKNAISQLPVVLNSLTRFVNFPFARGAESPFTILHSFGTQYVTMSPSQNRQLRLSVGAGTFSTLRTSVHLPSQEGDSPWMDMISCDMLEGEAEVTQEVVEERRIDEAINCEIKSKIEKHEMGLF